MMPNKTGLLLTQYIEMSAQLFSVAETVQNNSQTSTSRPLCCNPWWRGGNTWAYHGCDPSSSPAAATASQPGFNSWPYIACLSPFMSNAWWVYLGSFIPPLEEIKIVSDSDYGYFVGQTLLCGTKKQVFCLLSFFRQATSTPLPVFKRLFQICICYNDIYILRISLLISYLFLQPLFKKLVCLSFWSFTVIKNIKI